MSVLSKLKRRDALRNAEGVSWKDLASITLPEPLAEIVDRCYADPPLIVRPGEILCDEPLDHLAIALSDPTKVRSCFEALMQNSHGAIVIDNPRIWPDGDGCPQVHWRDRKWMATVQLQEGLQITLLAPHADGDVISDFLQKAGHDELHHVAVHVNHIRQCLVRVKESFDSVRQITPLAIDEDALAQVFLKFDPDHRIVELVERRPTFTGSFTCKNVKTLTAGERNHSFSDTHSDC